MSSQCGWREGCTETALEDKKLCQVHLDEAIRLRGIKRQNWQMAEQERLEEYYFIGKALDTAAKSAVLEAMTAETVLGEHKVVVGHARQNSKLFNYVTGKTKASQVPVAGWETAPFIKGAINEVATGLSLEAARLYADEYNRVLSASDIEHTTAAVV